MSLFVQLPDPSSKVRLETLLRVGARFEIWAGDLDNERVCVKVPVNPDTRSLYSMHHWLSVGSEAFSDGSTEPYQPGSDVLGDLLEIEADVISRTGKAWNHRTLGVGRVLAERSYEGPDPREWSRALVMPRHDGFTLDTVDPGERAGLLERMLPPLWTALCAAPHGDLTETNLIIDSDRAKFHLIDPGVRKTGWWAAEPDSWVLRDEVWNAVFITTPANYPILHPVFSGDDARRAQISSKHPSRNEPDWDEGDLFNEDLYPDFENFRDSIEPILQYRGESFSRSSGVPFALANLFELVEYHVAASSLGKVGVQSRHTKRAARPDPADLLALGIIYYRALTGSEAFLGPTALLAEPAWIGRHPRIGRAGRVELGPIPKTYERIQQALPGWIGSRITDHRIPTAKKPLLRALLALELTNIAELHQLLVQ
jgi:hypothetical protein